MEVENENENKMNLYEITPSVISKATTISLESAFSHKFSYKPIPKEQKFRRKREGGG